MGHQHGCRARLHLLLTAGTPKASRAPISARGGQCHCSPRRWRARGVASEIFVHILRLRTLLSEAWRAMVRLYERRRAFTIRSKHGDLAQYPCRSCIPARDSQQEEAAGGKRVFSETTTEAPVHFGRL